MGKWQEVAREWISLCLCQLAAGEPWLLCPCAGLGSGLRARGSPVPAAEQELLWGSLGLLALPLRKGVCNLSIYPQAFQLWVKTFSFIVSDLSCWIKKTFQLILKDLWASCSYNELSAVRAHASSGSLRMFICLLSFRSYIPQQCLCKSVFQLIIKMNKNT